MVDDPADFDVRDEANSQILTNFRNVAKSHAELFRIQRNHVHQLLGGAHNYSSGAYRENLLRSFLASVLPRSVSVDSGFVYGFDQVPASKQIDILVWDSWRHSAVFRTGEFVIIPPESVIAAISVKTTLGATEIRESLGNLLSLTPLETAYRGDVAPGTHEPLFPPVLKIIVGYEGPSRVETALNAVGAFFTEMVATEATLASEMEQAFQNFDPFRPISRHVAQAGRVLPQLLVAIDENPMSSVTGWGPPDDLMAERRFGPGLRRLPYMYAQDQKLTTPLEKLVFHVLRATYTVLDTRGQSLVAAWGEIDPVKGYRMGDASEILEGSGVRLFDPERLAPRPAQLSRTNIE